MRPGSQTKAKKKAKSLKIKTKKESGKTILEDNLDSNTKQLVIVEQDDGYDAEDEEYLAICNDYKENEEHDFVKSESGNHLILPVISQVWMNQCTPPEDDDKHNKQQANATEIDNEEGHTLNDQAAEESSPGVEKDTMKTIELVELELKIQKLEFEVNMLKEEVETEKVTVDALVKEKTYLISKRDMAMQRIEELESMLKRLKVERENEKNIGNSFIRRGIGNELK
ncbi:hypothetical protein L1987_20289 [Smallanthus sonchifolius]|uniref:Uncharacterized protein n=1 Tax=Smallanthus sonchifolius TaxID=185202 RepID=A0ACB9IRE2_9ASTR|nr:hypothetical protein L1987_20289 [Smallanthus sonchifolius]